VLEPRPENGEGETGGRSVEEKGVLRATVNGEHGETVIGVFMTAKIA